MFRFSVSFSCFDASFRCLVFGFGVSFWCFGVSWFSNAPSQLFQHHDQALCKAYHRQSVSRRQASYFWFPAVP